MLHRLPRLACAAGATGVLAGCAAQTSSRRAAAAAATDDSQQRSRRLDGRPSADLLQFGIGDIPRESYKEHFADAYNAAAVSNHERRTAQQPTHGTDEAQRRVRQSIARHLMRKLGYADEELLLLGDDVLRMQGVRSPFQRAALAEGESVLDLGSGFGTDAFLASMKVGERGRVTGLDISAEEVQCASNRAQEKDLAQRCSFVVGDMEHLPMGPSEYDCVISNGGFCLCPDKRAAFQEIHRVLKPGGKMVMNFVTHHQQMHGVWWGELIADGVRRWQANAPDQGHLEAAALAAGFDTAGIRFAPVCGIDESLYSDEVYLNPENFLDIESFRRSDSTFTLATEDEIDAAVARVQEMHADGSLSSWFKQQEQVREEIGQTTNLYLTKSE